MRILMELRVRVMKAKRHGALPEAGQGRGCQKFSSHAQQSGSIWGLDAWRMMALRSRSMAHPFGHFPAQTEMMPEAENLYFSGSIELGVTEWCATH
jgi:hypothetical protein